MNTERTPYREEDNESDDSSAVSFGQGPAFRPVPRIPLEKPQQPTPKPESVPRLGVLFDRSAVERVAKAEENEAEKKKEEDKKEKPAKKTPPKKKK